MSDTAKVAADELTEKFVTARQNGGSNAIRDFLFIFAIGIDRGIQIAKESNPPAA